jgi:hypothetical protein
MADTKISALTGVSAVADANEFAVNESGTSKKASASQLKTYMRTPAVPTVVSVGTEFSSTGTPTATLPGTHAANDILILCIITSNQAFSTPTGYTRAGPANGIGTAAAAGAVKLFVFWKRDGGAESAPTLSDSGDFTYGVMLAVRGCHTTGDPFTLGGQAWKFSTSTTGTGPISTVAGYNRLIMDIFAHHVDQAGANASSPTNADLTSVTEQFDDSTTDGTGGGIAIITGTRENPGTIGATTLTWATTSADVSTRLQFIPADDAPAPINNTPEVQFFIGSSADLDDTWVKPTGAKKVFVQTCDGGGSGSSGNTTTTAAGGGGGGGGMYDEQWYEAGQLGSTVTLHPGRGGAATTALNQAGNLGTTSWFDTVGPLRSGIHDAGTAATAAASADGGNGGCGSGRGTVAVLTTRVTLSSASNSAARGRTGAAGGSGTTAPTGGSVGDWGGGGGESGADTDAGIGVNANGNSNCGAGGGSGGRTNTNISASGYGGGASSVNSAQGAAGGDSSRLPYGGSGGVGGGSTTAAGGQGGFPGGGGGGGGGVANGFGGRGGHGCIVVTTFF